MTEVTMLEARPPDLSAVERVIVAGDLSKLSAAERWEYYQGVCRSLDLNPFTTPFAYITLQGKMTLYALKGATDQLRGKHHISIGKPLIDLSDGLCIVTVTARGPSGREDSDLGIVAIEGLRGDAKANAIMKAITKAKRRVTLSMLGLGMLDETEVETIPQAQMTPVEIPPDAREALVLTGEIIDAEAIPFPSAPPVDSTPEHATLDGIRDRLAERPGNLTSPPTGEELPHPPITSTHDPLWEGWQKLMASADHYGMSYPKLTLPIAHEDLAREGKELKRAVEAAKAQAK